MNGDQLEHVMDLDDRYRVEQVLSDGGYGVTELVTFDGAGPFVRKKIPLAVVDRMVWAALAECRSASVPTVQVTYELPDAFVVVLSYVPGRSLYEIVRDGRGMDQERAKAVMRALCAALEELHQRGVVHGDLAPQNVIIASDGAHLIDFGIARSMAGKRSVKAPSGRHHGTWGFAAPEQHGFAAVDVRSDVYGLGSLLAYMLTGYMPQDAYFSEALRDRARVPERCARVIDRARAFEPSARYQSASDLYEALMGDRDPDEAPTGEEAVEDAATPSGPSDRPAASVGSGSGHVLRNALIGLMAACVIAAVLILVLRAMDPSAPSDGSASQPADGALQAESQAPDAGQGADETPAASDATPEASQALSVSDFGWRYSQEGYLFFTFGLTNTSDGTLVDFPSVQVVGRDGSGSILCTATQAVASIYPGQTLYFSSMVESPAKPATVECLPVAPQDYQIGTATDDVPSSLYRVSNTSEYADEFGGTTVTGEVSLVDGARDYVDGSSGVAVTIVLRDEKGAIVDGTVAFVNGPSDGSPVPFSGEFSEAIPHSSYDVYAQPW